MSVYTRTCVCGTQCVEGVCMCVHRCTGLHISISLPLSLSESPCCCLKSHDQKLSSCVFFVWYSCLQGAWIAQWLECQMKFMIERSQVHVLAGVAGEYSSPGSTFCADSYFGIHPTAVLPQSHLKHPSHSAKSAGGRL